MLELRLAIRGTALTESRFFSSDNEALEELPTSLISLPMASNLSPRNPKKRGGQPRKHRTEEDATKAAKESKLRWYH